MEIKNIVIDRGNTSIKAGLFYGNALQEEFSSKDEHSLMSWMESNKPDFILFSSVVKDSGESLKTKFDPSRIIFFNAETPLPFKNLYASPQTLGPDRLAGVAGALSRFPYKNRLVIDAGTCITYDFIDKENNYFGGGISPGLKMRLKALNHFTAKLPLVECSENTDLIGTDTKSSILSGVLHGSVSEIDGIIEKYSAKFDGLQVLMCGGDTNFFESKLKAHIFAVANLVLFGLNNILLHNIQDFEAAN